MVKVIVTYRVNLEEMTDDPSVYTVKPTQIAVNEEMVKEGLDAWFSGDRKQGDKFIVQLEYKRALDV